MTDNTLTVIEIPNGDDFDGVWTQAEADEVSDAVDVLRKWGGREIVLRLLRPKDDRGKAFQTAFGLGNVWVEVSDVS